MHTEWSVLHDQHLSKIRDDKISSWDLTSWEMCTHTHTDDRATSGQIHSTVGGLSFVLCGVVVLQAKLFCSMVSGWCRLSHSMPLFSPALQVAVAQIEREKWKFVLGRSVDLWLLISCCPLEFVSSRGTAFFSLTKQAGRIVNDSAQVCLLWQFANWLVILQDGSSCKGSRLTPCPLPGDCDEPSRRSSGGLLFDREGLWWFFLLGSLEPCPCNILWKHFLRGPWNIALALAAQEEAQTLGEFRYVGHINGCVFDTLEASRFQAQIQIHANLPLYIMNRVNSFQFQSYKCSIHLLHLYWT